MDITDKGLEFRIATGGSNWVSIASEVMLALGGGLPYPGRKLPWPDDGRISVTSTGNDWTASSALRMIERGEAEAAITTPPATAAMAREGIGHFVEETDVAAIARLPHKDWLGFAVREDLGINSLQQIRDEEIPLKLARAPHQNPPMSNITGFLLDEILKQYGITNQRISEWGGTVDHGGRKCVDQLASGEYDAVFDEAMMTPDWKQITNVADLKFLSVDEEIISRITEFYGFERGTIPEGYLPGVTEDTDTISMSGWLLVIDESLSDAVGYHVARALDDRREQIQEYFRRKSKNYTNPPLSSEINMNTAWRETKIPLHPGAEQYYEQQGYK